MPRVINQSKGTVVAEKVQMAVGLWSRFWGLMFRKDLPDGHGLYLRSTYSIHTAFMRFPIDVLFLGRDGRVRKVATAVKPFRMAVARGAAGALELPAGAAAKANVEPGDVLVFADAS